MMQQQSAARRAIESRLSASERSKTFKCVGLTEDFRNATVEVTDEISQDDYVIHCCVHWRSIEQATIARISYK